MSTPEPTPGGGPDLSARRWSLVRGVLTFQAKMFLEGLRDLVLVPATLVAGLVGVLLLRERPERPYHEVLLIAHRFDRWLNLFGPIEHRDGTPPGGEGIDRYFESLERLIVEQHDRGGMTHTVRLRIDGWLDKLQQTTSRSDEPAEPKE